MAKHLLKFLLLTLLKSSFTLCLNLDPLGLDLLGSPATTASPTSAAPTCTKFQAIEPSDDDIDKVTEGLKKIEGVPYLLADYSNFENPVAALAKDTLDFSVGLTNLDAILPIKDLVQKYGYEFEEHTVTTDDDYILTIHRVPGKGMPVFIMHGTQGSSDDFLLNQEDSLVFLLVNAGYDLWLGNNRGNKYSRKHKSISPDCAEYWDFSFDEVGNYDLPASIDYILEKTGQDKLHYIGFSQGTTAFFVMTSLRPEYNAKIASAVTLATITFMIDIIDPVFRMFAANKTIENIVLDASGQYEVTNSAKISKAISSVLCADNLIATNLCAKFIYYLVGFDISELYFPFLFSLATRYSSGCAANQFRHYTQTVASGEFKRFDFGETKNLAKYGSAAPPKYDLSKVTSKLTIFYGAGDWLTSDASLSRLKNELTNAKVNLIKLDNFSHVANLNSKNVRANLFEKVVDAIKNA